MADRNSYRIWDKDNKRFLTRFAGANKTEIDHFSIDNHQYSGWGIDGYGGYKKCGEHVIYQQSTGRTDDNGKDIFDGDLIKGDNYGPYRVFWDDELCGWCSCCYSDSELISRYKSIEVVGNIFENPKYEGVQ